MKPDKTPKQKKKRKRIYPWQVLNKHKRERLWTALLYEITSEKILFFRDELQSKIAEFIGSDFENQARLDSDLEHEMLHTHWHRTFQILEFVLNSEHRIDPEIFNKILEEEDSRYRYYPQEEIFREVHHEINDRDIRTALSKTKDDFTDIHDKIILALRMSRNLWEDDKKMAMIISFSAVKDLLNKITGESKYIRKQIEEVYKDIVPGDGDLRKVSLLTLLDHLEREQGIYKWHKERKLSESRSDSFSFVSACCRFVIDLIEILDPVSSTG